MYSWVKNFLFLTSFFHKQIVSNPDSWMNLCIKSKILIPNIILVFVNIFHILNPLRNARERERAHDWPHSKETSNLSVPSWPTRSAPSDAFFPCWLYSWLLMGGFRATFLLICWLFLTQIWQSGFGLLGCQGQRQAHHLEHK